MRELGEMKPIFVERYSDYYTVRCVTWDPRHKYQAVVYNVLECKTGGGGGVAKAAMTPKLDPLGEQVCSSGGLKVTQPGLICWTVIWHNPCGWNNLCLNTTSSSTRWKVNKAKQRYSTDNTDRWKLKLKTHPVPSMLWQAFIVLRRLSFHCWEIKRLSFGGAWSG